jgi:hypothetical protein
MKNTKMKKPIVIVNLLGGLGTQMSQYAYAKELEKRGYKVKLDASIYKYYKLREYGLKDFNISIELADALDLEPFLSKKKVIKTLHKLRPNNIILRILNRLGVNTKGDNVIVENSHEFNKDFLDLKRDTYIIGDFKCEKYFEGVRAILIDDFTLRNYPSHYFESMIAKIKHSPDTCFVHIRRGDYISNSKVAKIHGVCNKKYYLDAMSYIESKIPDIVFFMFSDDIDWCEANFNAKNIVFMRNHERTNPNEDILLMSNCDHAIIDNSSFCWWGAWLIQNKYSIIIAPKEWYAVSHFQQTSKDIYCENWIKLD